MIIFSSIEAVRILDKLKTQNNPTINNFVGNTIYSSNSVILSSNEFVAKNIKSTLNTLDKDITNNDTADVIYLKYAKAQDVASIL